MLTTTPGGRGIIVSVGIIAINRHICEVVYDSTARVWVEGRDSLIDPQAHWPHIWTSSELEEDSEVSAAGWESSSVPSSGSEAPADDSDAPAGDYEARASSP